MLLMPLSKPVRSKESKKDLSCTFLLTLHPHVPLNDKRREEEVQTDRTVRVPLEIRHEETEADKHHYVHFLLIYTLFTFLTPKQPVGSRKTRDDLRYALCARPPVFDNA